MTLQRRARDTGKEIVAEDAIATRMLLLLVRLAQQSRPLRCRQRSAAARVSGHRRRCRGVRAHDRPKHHRLPLGARGLRRAAFVAREPLGVRGGCATARAARGPRRDSDHDRLRCPGERFVAVECAVSRRADVSRCGAAVARLSADPTSRGAPARRGGRARRPFVRGARDQGVHAGHRGVAPFLRARRRGGHGDPEPSSARRLACGTAVGDGEPGIFGGDRGPAGA